MGKEVASLYATLGIDTKAFENGLKNSQSKLKGLNDAFKSITGVSLGFTGAISALGKALQFSISEAMESEKATKKLESALQSTQFAAGMTQDELTGLAKSLSMVTTYGDDAIIEAEAIMLTFTKVGKEVFPEAIESAMNLSQAFGQDLQASIIQVGKALNDPSGMAAMKRIGVSFTDAQMEMGKELYATGKIAEYQKLILQELNTEVGGMAREMTTTYAGQVEIFKNEMEELGESVGSVIIPILSDAAKALNQLLTLKKYYTEQTNLAANSMASENIAYEEYESRVIAAAKAAMILKGDQLDMYENIKRINFELANNNNLSKIQIANYTQQQENYYKAGGAFDRLAEKINLLSREEYDAMVQSLGLANAIESASDNSESYALTQEELNGKLSELKTIVSGSWGKEIENFNDSLAENAKKQKDIQAEIDILNGKTWLTSAQKEQLKDLQDDLQDVQDEAIELREEHERTMKTMAFNMLIAKAESEGLTETEVGNLTKIAEAWGLWDEATATAVENVNKINLDEAMNTMLDWQELLKKIPTNITTKVNVITGNITPLTGTSLVKPSTTMTQTTHAAGGSIMLPASAGYEGVNLGGGHTASGNEMVTVSNQNQITDITKSLSDAISMLRRLPADIKVAVRDGALQASA